MGLAYGYSLTRPIHQGPVEDAFNGSLSALAYALLSCWVIRGCSSWGPCAQPDLLLRAGGLAPPSKWGGLLGSRRRGGGRTSAGIPLVVHRLRAFDDEPPPLRASPTEVHADSPALALAALAVVVMVRGGGGQNAWTSSLALILAFVAVWALQLAVPLLLVALSGFALATGARALCRWLLPAAVGGAAIALILLAAFDTSRLGSGSIVAPFRGRGWLDLLTPIILFQEKHAPCSICWPWDSWAGSEQPPRRLGSRATSDSTRFRLQFRDAEWVVLLILGLAELAFSAAGLFRDRS